MVPEVQVGVISKKKTKKLSRFCCKVAHEPEFDINVNVKHTGAGIGKEDHGSLSSYDATSWNYHGKI